ncbi:MAG: helix-turn-helix transcriptional regulator [Halobacteriovoraceae bacterium]|nr:helix-turn-helix transcriptional regulator [Halobacteriovoraceae bacterium]
MGSIDKVRLTSGKILKALRIRFGYTQKDVSGAINISVSNLSALENDKRNLGVELAAKFSVLYGTRIESLLFPNGLKAMKGYNALIKKIEKLKEVA